MAVSDATSQTNDSPVPQVLNAYRRLTRAELILFLKVRNLPTSGSDHDLANRLTNHDIHTYHFPTDALPPNGVPKPPSVNAQLPITLASKHKLRQEHPSTSADLPIEIIADI